MNTEELNQNEFLEVSNDSQEEKNEVKKIPGKRGKKKKTTSKDIIKKTIDMSKETERQLIELSMFYKTYQTKTLETIIQSVYNEKLKEMNVKNNEPLEQKIIELILELNEVKDKFSNLVEENKNHKNNIEKFIQSILDEQIKIYSQKFEELSNSKIEQTLTEKFDNTNKLISHTKKTITRKIEDETITGKLKRLF